MISWRMTAAWIAALVVATVLAWQIVGLADSQVGDTPVAVAPSLTTTTADGGGSTTLPSTTTSTTDAGPTTTTTPGNTTSSSADTSTSSSTASTSSNSSTSTTASEQWSLRTVTTTGGVVVVRYRTGEVELQAATPAPGFSVEVDDAGPPRVRVEFESEVSDIRVEARWEDGSLDVDVDG